MSQRERLQRRQRREGAVWNAGDGVAIEDQHPQVNAPRELIRQRGQRVGGEREPLQVHERADRRRQRRDLVVRRVDVAALGSHVRGEDLGWQGREAGVAKAHDAGGFPRHLALRRVAGDILGRVRGLLRQAAPHDGDTGSPVHRPTTVPCRGGPESSLWPKPTTNCECRRRGRPDAAAAEKALERCAREVMTSA